MKKNKVVEDFNVYSVPETRKEQFKDIMKNRYLTLLSLGAILVLFSIPMLLIYWGKGYFILSSVSSLIGENAEPETIQFNVIGLTAIFDVIQAIGYLLFFVGISGASKVIKSLCFNENVFMKEHFFQGVKENSKQMIIVSLIVSISTLVFDLLINLGEYSSNSSISYGSWIAVGMFGFLIIPTLLLSISFITTYKDNYGNHFKNSMLIGFKHYFPTSFFSLGLLTVVIGIYILNLFVNSIISVVSCVVIILYVLPIFMLAHYLYSLELFDKYININYPEIYKKGLREYYKK